MFAERLMAAFGAELRRALTHEPDQLAVIGDRLQEALTRAESDESLRAALLADPRTTLAAAGVPLPLDGEVEAAEGPGGRLFVGIPVAPEACTDVELPGEPNERPHHLDCG